MHTKHRHPEIHLGSGIPFSRKDHALHGLPQCRFCRQHLYDFASLRKHIATGTCAVLKTAAARRTPTAVLWQEVLDRERDDPPLAPSGLPEVDLEIDDEWLAAPLPDVLNHVRLLQRARHTCLLCGQRLIGMTRIKKHWRSSHASAWSLTESYMMGAMRSISSMFKVPCDYCGSRAKSSEAHSKQCYVTFQILAMRRLHQLSKLEEVRQVVVAVQQRQDKANPEYASFALSAIPIGRALGLSTTTSTDRPEMRMPRTEATSQQTSPVRPPPISSSVLLQWDDEASRSWPARLVLLNPSSHCYANACMLSQCHTWGLTRHVPEAFRLLYTMLRTPANLGVSVSLHTQPLLRRLLTDWEFSSTQQDALEFLTALMRSGSNHDVLWSSRIDELGVVRSMDYGNVISLTLPDSGSQLQELVDSWHDQMGVHALLEAANVVLLHLGRYRHGRKVLSRVQFLDDISLPCFGEGIRSVWLIYRPIAAVVHLGPRATEGHSVRCSDMETPGCTQMTT